jgi:hypothetical protein
VTVACALAAAAVLVGATVGPASPARADDTMSGLYTYTQAGLPQSSWTITPICVPVVGDLRQPLYLPVGCTLHVASATSSQVTDELRQQNFGGDARLTNGLWTIVMNKPNGMVCPDGSTAPTVDTYAYDDATLQGTHTSTHGEVCGMQPGLTKVPFTLQFNGPLPFSFDPYPLRCDPGGLRICS